MTLVDQYRAAWETHGAQARDTYELFVSYCGKAPCAVPGMDTRWRLAVRLSTGRSTEQAAAREYLYRWELALRSPIFGVPHLLGV